ncbi:MAG: beta-ketoacyl-ACP synthase III [Chlamydiales bacterium]|nr:beta-ketoacyl-ACP synthase III [Chlamydiales bacterium]
MTSKLKARIVGTGSYLPQKVLTNHDLERLVDTSDEWIVTRTGMKERRIAAEDEHTSDMGAAAALRALENAGRTVADIDLILVATMSPDHPIPSTASFVQRLLGAKGAAAADIQAACTGYIYGLSMAKAYIESGMYRNVLLVASEKMSAIIDYTDRNTCVLFGDGAAAAIISAEGEGLYIDTISLGADGELAELLIIPAGGTKMSASAESVANRKHYFQMSGKEVFKHAVRRMSSAAETCLEKAGIGATEVSWLVPHQANVRIMDAFSKSFDIPPERVFKTIHKYGNTSASGVGIALDELLVAHPPATGEHILLVAFGGGLTWGASVLSKVEE